jgi:F plasmid transfer operon protein TraF
MAGLTNRAIIVFVFCLLVAANSFAAEFQSIGFDALSMGGAGVASSRGSYATYYNPALLAVPKHKTEVALSAGIAFREVNLARHIDSISDLNFEESSFGSDDNVQGTLDWLASLSPSDLAENEIRAASLSDHPAITNLKIIKRALAGLGDTNGLHIMPTASLAIQAGNFGFGVYGLSEAAAYTIIDDRQDIIINAGADYYIKYDDVADAFSAVSQDVYENNSLEYAIQNDLTTLNLTGLTYLEIPVAYGHKFETGYGQVCIGGSLKLMPGRTYSETITIDTDSGDIQDRFDDSEESDTAFGIDMGLLYIPQQLPKLSTGLVCKNLNTPEFDTIDGGSLKVKPQVRWGVAYDLLDDRVTLALDADLTNNETYISGYNARFIGGGINYHPTNWFSLRGGMMKNISEGDEGPILTAGVGIGIKWFQIDLAGQYSTKSGEFEDEEIPQYGRATVSIVSKWK